MLAEESTNLIGCIALFLLLCLGAVWGYNFLDDAGWIPHDYTVNLYMKGNWLNGENRECTGFQAGLGETAHLKSLSCSDDDNLDDDTPPQYFSQILGQGLSSGNDEGWNVLVLEMCPNWRRVCL